MGEETTEVRANIIMFSAGTESSKSSMVVLRNCTRSHFLKLSCDINSTSIQKCLEMQSHVLSSVGHTYK